MDDLIEERDGAFVSSQRERQGCLQPLPTRSGNKHTQDARGTWLRAHKRWVGNNRGNGNTVISQKEVVNTLACCRAGGQGHGKHERERWEQDWRAGCRADLRMLLLK